METSRDEKHPKNLSHIEYGRKEIQSRKARLHNAAALYMTGKRMHQKSLMVKQKNSS